MPTRQPRENPPRLTRRGFVAGAAALAASAGVSGPLSGAAASSSRRRRPAARARFRPPPGTALVLAGQTAADLGGTGRPGRDDGYLDHVPITPAGITTYLGLPARATPVPRGGPLAGNDVVGLLALPRLRHCLLHLSVNWAPNDLPANPTQVAENLAAQQALVSGALDPWLDALADWCRRQRRPILLRAGYEFNRFPTDTYYDRRLYVPAFRRLVGRFRARRANNVAFVWSSANLNWGAPTGTPFDTRSPDTWDFNAWYPGDEYVDWFGFSFWFPDDPDTVMLEQARRRGKPILLAETTPAGYDLRTGQHFGLGGALLAQLTSDEVWRSWFAPYFAFIQAHRDVIAGFHYIAADWKADPEWLHTPPFIGSDARLWEDGAILRHWTSTLRDPRYLAGDDRLETQLS